jgi:hypothetical protein
MEGYHGAIVQRHAPDWSLGYAAGVGLLGILIGAMYFIRREQQFGKLV